MSEGQLSNRERENGTRFAPQYGPDGLLTCVVVDSETGEVLVVAHMNAEALKHTRERGRVHFWSRSRQELWLKGGTSGNYLEVREILVDCDQDALLVRAKPAGPTCHTGAPSCFYRELDPGADDAEALSPISR